MAPEITVDETKPHKTKEMPSPLSGGHNIKVKEVEKLKIP